jgi:hypothetical protein
MQKSTFIRILVVSGVLIALCLMTVKLLNNPQYVTLSSAPALGGQVAQALQTAGQANSIPVPGKDFTLSNVKYFSNGTWAVVDIKPTDPNAFNKSIAILQKQQGVFRVILGPSSSLPRDYASSLPDDLNGYLFQRGVFN